MTTATPIPQRRRGARVVLTPPRRRLDRRGGATERLAEARAREARARHALAEGFVRMERAHALAAHDLEQFEAYLNELRNHLRRAGYLTGA